MKITLVHPVLFFGEGGKGVSYVVGQTWNDSLDLAKPGCARV